MIVTAGSGLKTESSMLRVTVEQGSVSSIRKSIEFSVVA